jgi:hypothetical protein
VIAQRIPAIIRHASVNVLVQFCSPGQQSRRFDCLGGMARMKENKKKLEVPSETLSASVYEQPTPMWSRYYHAMRKRIRFPRYYKRAVNW